MTLIHILLRASMSSDTSAPRSETPGSAILEDTPIGHAYRIPLQRFLDDLLPPLQPGIDLDALIEQLSHPGRGRAAIGASTGRLWGYGAKDPSDVHKKNEKKAYAHISWSTGRFSAVAQADGLQANFEFRNNPHAIPKLDKRRDAEYLPDAYFVPLSMSRGTSVKWQDIAVPGEYRVPDSRENAQEVRIFA